MSDQSTASRVMEATKDLPLAPHQSIPPPIPSPAIEKAKELTHGFGEHYLTHVAGGWLEQAGNGLKSLLKTRPGITTLRPWLSKAAPALEGAGEFLASKPFAIATEMLKSSPITGSELPLRDRPPTLSQKRAEQMKPKVEQGIAYKNGAVYYPQSRQWIMPPITIRPSHETKQQISYKRPVATPPNPTLQSRTASFGVGQTARPPVKPAGTPTFRTNQVENLGMLHPAEHLQPPVSNATRTRMQLTAPRLGQSLPFRPMIRPSFSIPPLRPPFMKGGFR
jgi:hypothetical protein